MSAFVKPTPEGKAPQTLAVDQTEALTPEAALAFEIYKSQIIAAGPDAPWIDPEGSFQLAEQFINKARELNLTIKQDAHKVHR